MASKVNADARRHFPSSKSHVSIWIFTYHRRMALQVRSEVMIGRGMWVTRCKRVEHSVSSTYDRH
jgi:hypothetical protein